tara:strand:+ start:81 stop:545 length:465 start_codon:yes stop_codon:yes gene_type:complete
MFHRHKYVMGPTKNGWSYAMCKYCKGTDIFRVYIDRSWSGYSSPPTFADKREALRFQGHTITKKYWGDGEKDKILNSVKEIGINATAKKMNLPASTVGLWTKGTSKNPRNKDKYTDLFREYAIKEYKKYKNFRKVSLLLQIPRSTLQSWVKNLL